VTKNFETIYGRENFWHIPKKRQCSCQLPKALTQLVSEYKNVYNKIN